ncbi:MAG TPA: protein-disulfide reductase DsbD domain-containing protein, partial [Pirellulales bacterium]
MRQALLAGHRVAWVGLALVIAAATPASGQLDLGAIGGNLSGGPAAAAGPVMIEAHIAPARNGQVPQLVVTADIGTGWHIYSLTQKSGGPVRSKITIDPGAGYKVAGDFKSVTPPESHVEPVFNNLPVETHEGQAIWSAPLELTPGTDPAGLSIAGKFAYQACDESSCLPPTSVKFTATYNKDAAAPGLPQPRVVGDAGSYKPGTAHVVIRGHVEPTVATPGGVARLVISAEPTDGWHVYALADRDPPKISKPTLIALSETAGLKSSPPSAAGKLIEKASTAAPGEKERYYEQPVTWTIDLAVPQDAAPGDHKLAGLIGFQTCRDGTGCDLPQAVQFQVTLPVDAQHKPGTIPLVFTPAKSYKQVADAAARGAVGEASAGFDPTKVQPAASGGGESIFFMLGAALLGGLILNCMPCVLPVIGLKILGFVEQSHQSRRSVFMLNVWFTLGLLSVFVLLASL